ncbi:MAG: thioredoxin fold domain-containing protein [Phycisphaerae bacterium]|nr:thioredoxin fold domain-containing protein [Phycisphaerae bacterium]
MMRVTLLLASCAMAAVLAGHTWIAPVAAQEAATPAPAAQEAAPVPAPATPPTPAADGHKDDGWLSNLDEAKKQAAAAGKPIFIDFFAVWCGPCKTLDAQTFSDEGVKALLAKFVTVRIDVDKDQATSQAYNISAMPTLVAADADGKVLVRHTGFIPPSGMKEMLTDVLKLYESMAAYKKDASNTEALFQVAELCSRMELSKDEKLGYIDAATKAAKPEDTARLAKLKLARGLTLAMAGDAQEQATQSLQEAAKLDADNAQGVREQADWYLGLLDTGDGSDPAKFAKISAKFMADYPKDKLKNPDLRLQAMMMHFQASHRQGDLKAAIATLETLKAEFSEKLGADKIDQALNTLKEQLKLEQQEDAPAPKPEPAQPDKAPDGNPPAAPTPAQ